MSESPTTTVVLYEIEGCEKRNELSTTEHHKHHICSLFIASHADLILLTDHATRKHNIRRKGGVIEYIGHTRTYFVHLHARAHLEFALHASVGVGMGSAFTTVDRITLETTYERGG